MNKLDIRFNDHNGHYNKAELYLTSFDKLLLVAIDLYRAAYHVYMCRIIKDDGTIFIVDDNCIRRVSQFIEHYKEHERSKQWENQEKLYH